jgi:hypothetical protein
MTERQDLSKCLSALQNLTVEELECLLKDAVFPQSGSENEKLVDAIIDAILKKETENPTGRLTDIESAWKEFQEHYKNK